MHRRVALGGLGFLAVALLAGAAAVSLRSRVDSGEARLAAAGAGVTRRARAVRNEMPNPPVDGSAGIQTDSADRRNRILALLLLAAAGRKAPVLSGREASAPPPGAQETE